MPTQRFAADFEKIEMRGFLFLADAEALKKWRFGARAKGRAAPRVPPGGHLALTQFPERVQVIGGFAWVVEDVD